MHQRRSLLAALIATWLAPVALAGPLDDPHVADTGFSGPTSGDLTAVVWNPAGLGLLQGPQAMIGGVLRQTSVTVDRASIDPATGTSPGSTTFLSQSGSATSQPARWPLGPNGFFALGAGIGRRFGIAVALYAPYASKLSMNPTANPTADAPEAARYPTRYHLVSMQTNHIAPVVGLAIHASDSIQLGIAPGMLLPSAHLVFYDDPTLGAEDPAKAIRYDLATRGTLLTPTYFLSLGAHYRRGRLSLGLGYTSAPLGSGGLVTLPLDNTQIGTSMCPASNPSCLHAQMSYRLPSIWTFGATWQATKYLAASAIVRWVRTGSHDKVTILVTGPTSQPDLGTTIPDHVVLYRGFVDSVDVRGRLVYQSDHLRVGATLRLTTSAVPADRVTAASIDGTTLEPMLSVEFRIWRQISLSAGYAFATMLPVHTGTSAFDPTALSTCTASGGDLTTPACRARMDGRARPSAAGTYHFHQQTLSVLTTFGF